MASILVRSLTSRTVLAVLIPLGAAGVFSCGGGDGGGEAARAPDATAAAVSLDACTILAEADVSAMLGGATDPAIPVIQTSTGPVSVSHCVVSAADGASTIGLMLRHSSVETVPTTREAFISGERAADVLGMGEEAAQALAAAEDVPGVGDLALFYEMFGYNLAVFWKQHYEMIVSVNIADRAAALQHARAIAQRVLARH